MKIFHGVAELTAAVGTHLGHSNWIDVDQARVNLFADATDDHQWIHIDPERALQGPFGSTIAHGYLTLSLMSEMMWQAYRVDGLAMQINYGCNKFRFPAPVPVPSRLRAGVEPPLWNRSETDTSAPSWLRSSAKAGSNRSASPKF